MSGKDPIAEPHRPRRTAQSPGADTERHDRTRSRYPAELAGVLAPFMRPLLPDDAGNAGPQAAP